MSETESGRRGFLGEIGTALGSAVRRPGFGILSALLGADVASATVEVDGRTHWTKLSEVTSPDREGWVLPGGVRATLVMRSLEPLTVTGLPFAQNIVSTAIQPITYAQGGLRFVVGCTHGSGADVMELAVDTERVVHRVDSVVNNKFLGGQLGAMCATPWGSFLACDHNGVLQEWGSRSAGLVERKVFGALAREGTPALFTKAGRPCALYVCGSSSVYKILSRAYFDGRQLSANQNMLSTGAVYRCDLPQGNDVSEWQAVDELDAVVSDGPSGAFALNGTTGELYVVSAVGDKQVMLVIEDSGAGLSQRECAFTWPLGLVDAPHITSMVSDGVHLWLCASMHNGGSGIFRCTAAQFNEADLIVPLSTVALCMSASTLQIAFLGDVGLVATATSDLGEAKIFALK